MLTKTPLRLLAKTAAGRKRGPQPADLALGAAVRFRRHALGMSQTTLGNRLGVTFQQVQKYENGTNRISGGRLIAAAKVLDTTVAELTGEAVEAGRTGIASPTLLLLARSEPARRLMVQVQRLHAAKRAAAIVDLARTAEQMLRP
jgi:transcriptional regulator with XRE-family HTH domain